jgi:RNA-directed DNA polymerase
LFSPLLSNIMLDDEFGKELERRDHRFDRYADDICIYLKGERADQRVLESVSTLSDDRLKFNVNHKKCRVALATNRGYLCGVLGRTRTCDLLCS